VPGTRYQATNRGDDPLTFSEHRIAPEVAFLPDAT
jgi:hypothetical protein